MCKCANIHTSKVVYAEIMRALEESTKGMLGTETIWPLNLDESTALLLPQPAFAQDIVVLSLPVTVAFHTNVGVSSQKLAKTNECTFLVEIGLWT